MGQVSPSPEESDAWVPTDPATDLIERNPVCYERVRWCVARLHYDGFVYVRSVVDDSGKLICHG
ncbi:MAG: hypothetical protein QM784_02915 [Polyangiaceae bacterium]